MSINKMSKYSFETIVERLLEVLPELLPEYEKGTGAHIAFGDLLNPYLISLLKTDNRLALRKVFTLLEELANHEDIMVQEVVAVTVCERLGDNPEWLSRAREYMGETTLKFSHEVEAFWGRK